NLAKAKPNLTISPSSTAIGAQIFRASERHAGSGWIGRYSRSGSSGCCICLRDFDRPAVGLDGRPREDAVDVDRRLVVAAVGSGVAADRDVRGAGGLLVEHDVTPWGDGVVEPDSELGDDVGAVSGLLDDRAQQVGGAAALDRGDAPAREA